VRHLLFFLVLCFGGSLHAQEKIFTLSDEYLFSSAQVVANEKHIGNFDMGQKSFLLLDADSGEVLTNIDARDSFPGFNWSPFSAKLLENEVFFINGAPFGVYISIENKVTHVADRYFKSTAAFDFLSDSVYVGFYTVPSGDHHIAMVDRDGNEVAPPFEVTPLRFPNLAYRSENQSLVVFEGRIYLVPPYEQDVYVYNVNGELEQKIDLGIPGFVRPSRDKRKVDFQNVIHEVLAVTRGKSTVMNVFAMENQTLLFWSTHSIGDADGVNMLTTLNVRTQEKESKIISRDQIPAFGTENLLYFIDIEKEPVEIRVVSFAEFWSSF
jgi:hypothetical protein